MSEAELPDMDTPQRIATFIHAFYRRLLADPELGPIFVAVAEVDLDKHLPLICSYWEKLLLGTADYRRHTMNIHRALHAKRALTAEDFDRWLQFFTDTLATLYRGPVAERAAQVATSIAGNMKQSLQVQR